MLTPKDINKDDIEGYDCRHATYCRANDSNEDLLVVKEYIQLKDKTRIPNIRLVKNFKRDFYVTKPGYRNHKDKKEWEEENRLQLYTCTQAELPKAVARALGKPGVSLPLRQLASSPFLYGTDIGPVPLLKNEYQKRWQNCIAPTASVAVMDIETDVVNGTEDIIVITLSFKDKIITATTRAYLGTMIDPIPKIHDAFEKYLGEYKQKRNINLELYIGDTPGDICEAVLKKAHEWKPDFITFWNINFDMPRIIGAFIKDNRILEDVFSDPAVPIEFRHFKYIEGPAQKKTQSGKITPMHPADRWHTVSTPASFYFLDSMCLYKRLRLAKGQEPSYSLDAILTKHLNLTKLKFKELEGVSKLEWHQQMQTRFKIEYIIYNIFDCIGVELLDEKTGDISQAFPALCELSDFNDFKSTPRRIVTDMHFFCREHGKVIAACGPEMVDELDSKVVGVDNWIVTLPAHMASNAGLNIIKEIPEQKTLFNSMLADLDVEGTYPNEEDIMNISKETTMCELSVIEGVPLSVQRKIGINLTTGNTNAIEICQDVFNLPPARMWLEPYLNQR